MSELTIQTITLPHEQSFTIRCTRKDGKPGQEEFVVPRGTTIRQLKEMLATRQSHKSLTYHMMAEQSEENKLVLADQVTVENAFESCGISSEAPLTVSYTTESSMGCDCCECCAALCACCACCACCCCVAEEAL